LKIRHRICVSIIESSERDVFTAAREAEEKGADLVEIRLDGLERLTHESIAQLFRYLSDIRLPKIATIMPKNLFGRFEGDDSKRVELLSEAAEYADYVDIGLEMEPSMLIECIKRVEKRAEVILSRHSDRPLTAGEISSTVREDHRGTVYKVAMLARGVEDNLVALEACRFLEGFRRIIFCYGRAGIISRVLSPFFGSEWAYASLRKGKEAAPGQLDIESLRKVQGVLGG
jgi:3-dehydroquinate dehydratase type I